MLEGSRELLQPWQSAHRVWVGVMSFPMLGRAARSIAWGAVWEPYPGTPSPRRSSIYLGKFTRLLGAPGIVPGPSLEMSAILHTEWEETDIFTHSSSSSSSHLPHFFLGPLLLPLSLSSLSLSLFLSAHPHLPPTHTILGYICHFFQGSLLE